MHGWAPLDLARAFLAGGAKLLQLRAKRLGSGPFLELAAAVVTEGHAVGATVIVNDRADVTLWADAAGLHIGQDDIAPEDARHLTGPDRLIGLSTHTDAQIARALHEPIDYFAIGPVFGSRTKATGYDGVGLGAVRDAARGGASVGLPVVAIGGITLDSAASVIAAGAASVAVISDLLTNDPEARVRHYLQRVLA